MGKLRNHLAFGAGINAGIVLGYTSLIIVTARSISGNNYEILNWGKEFYGEGITRNSPDFQEVLKAILARYLKGVPRVRIWCTIQSKGVETRFMVLPDMPAKHLSKAVFWSFKKEVELGHGEVVFDFDVTGTRLLQDKKEIEVLACSAPVKDLSDIKELFRRTGWPLTGITVTSFAFQNLFRTGFSGEGSQNIGTLFIGTDWSRIDIFSKGSLILSRDIKTGTRSMTEVLDEHVMAEPEPDDGISMDSYLESEEGQVSDQEKDTEGQGNVSKGPVIISDNLIEGIHEGSPEQIEQMFNLVLPAVDRLIRQIERTFEHFSMTMKGQKVERLYFTGPLCAFVPLMTYTRGQLGIPVMTINPFEKIETLSPKSARETSAQDEFVPATGLALSETEHTLNFNFTYKDKEKKHKNRLLTQVLGVAIILVSVLGFVSHERLLHKQNIIDGEILVMSHELSLRDAQYGQAGIIDFSDHIRLNKKQERIQGQTHTGAAVLAEVSLLTPQDIKLSSFLYEETNGDLKHRSLFIQGIVLNVNRKILDDYSESLRTSRLVHSLVLTHVGEKELDGKKVIYFESTMELYD